MTQPTFRGGGHLHRVGVTVWAAGWVRGTAVFTWHEPVPFREQTDESAGTVVGKGLTMTTFCVICIFQNLSSKIDLPSLTNIHKLAVCPRFSSQKKKVGLQTLSFWLQWFLPNVTGFGMKAGKLPF